MINDSNSIYSTQETNSIVFTHIIQNYKIFLILNNSNGVLF